MKISKTIKTIIILVAVVLVLGAGWYFYKRKNADPVSGLKPRVDMSIAHISDVTDSTVNMELKALVHNPLPVGLDVRKFSYSVQMNGKTIVEDLYGKPLRVGARDSSLVKLPAQLKIRNLRDEGDQEAAKGQDSADYRFESVFYLEKPFLGKDSISFSVDKRLPLYRLPEVKMAGYDLKKLGLKDTEIVIKMEVTNNNPFSIEFRNPMYAMDLGKQKRFAEGKVTGITKVKGKSKDIYEIPLSVSLGKVIKAAGQMITKGKEMPFTFYFKSKIISENEVINGSDMNLIMDGELKDVQQFQKNLDRK